jgi:hypothetical protein
MCPVCAATAAMISVSIAASIATTGGLAAVVLKRAAIVKSESNPQPSNPSKEDIHG